MVTVFKATTILILIIITTEAVMALQTIWVMAWVGTADTA